MLTIEMELAAKAPHHVVLLDGSLLTPLICFNQAMTKLGEVPKELAVLHCIIYSDHFQTGNVAMQQQCLMSSSARYCYMVAGYSAPQRSSKAYGKVYHWFRKNEQRLLAIGIICIFVLFFIQLFSSTIQVSGQQIVNAVQILAIVLVAFIVLSILSKGFVPLLLCVLGVVLICYSVILPYNSDLAMGDQNPGGTKFTYPHFTPSIAGTSSNMHFFLGVSAVALSMIFAYRPSLMFTRRRPEPLDSEWSRYPIWHDNTLLAEGHAERSVPIKDFLTDQERYLLWRYDYLLADIYGTPHLVEPSGLVPKDSTRIFRDRHSGGVIGKARYSGYFI